MKWLLLGLCFILPPQFAPHNFEPVYKLAQSYTFFETDNLQNLYLVDGPQLQKFSAAGSLMFRYSNQTLGAISGVDARYSLRPMLFYKDLNRLIILDNTLSERQHTVELEQKGLQFATLAAMSINNNYWFYDASAFELIRTNGQFHTLAQTGNLGQLLRKDNLDPNYLLERDNWVYLNDPKLGILVFDMYGTYNKTVPLTGLKRFNVRGNYITGCTPYALLRYNSKDFTIDTVLRKDSGFKQALIEQDYIFVGSDSTINAFKELNTPGSQK